MYWYEILEHVDTQVDNATVAHLDGLWHRYQEADGTLPQFTDLSPDRLDWCAADLMVLEPVDTDDFVYRHYGAQIARASGFDMTGRRVSEFRSEVGRFFRDKYRQCLESRRPLYTVHTASHAPTVHTWERLIMPVRDGPRAVLLVYNRPLALRHEFLQSVLEATTNGIVALATVRDAAGELSDFHVINANRAACEILATDARTLVDARLGEGFPTQFAGRIADLARSAFESREVVAAEVHGMHNGVHRFLQVGAARAGDGVTLAVSDVTALRGRERELRDLNMRLEREIGGRRPPESGMPEAAEFDHLTGVLGEAAWLHRLAAEVARAERHARALGVLLLDVDNLGAVNDVQGLAAGDRVLARTADVCREVLRRGDFVGRVDGAAFAICLPETGRSSVRLAAERLRAAVAAAFSEQAMLSMRVTASVGVTSYRQGDPARGLLDRARAARRAAKAAGRDRVAVAAGDDDWPP